jgi:hypothetical protein
MVYGAINEKGEKYYTYLPKLFDSIDNAQKNYNWLVTACECNVQNRVEDECLKQGYCWISGDELTKVVHEQHIQWIWAVLSGFEKDVPLEKVLEYPFPEADGYSGFWHNPITMQHPLAKIEIVPWDSGLTLFFSKDKELVQKFRCGFPQSEDLAAYNTRFAK